MEANLNSICPFFIAADLKKSVAFYVEKLGFEIHFIGPPEDHYFAIVGRDNIYLMLKEITPEIKPVPNYTRHGWAKWDAYINVRDPKTLYEEYQSRGITFREELHVNGDDLYGFELFDADGYGLYFGRPNAKD